MLTINIFFYLKTNKNLSFGLVSAGKGGLFVPIEIGNIRDSIAKLLNRIILGIALLNS